MRNLVGSFVPLAFVWLACLAGASLVFAPLAVAQDRNGGQHQVTVSVVDHDSGEPLASRIYLTSSDGVPYFFESTDEEGSAFRYAKTNRINQRSVEHHTTVSAHPGRTHVPAGTYRLTVERGKTYFPVTQMLDVGDRDVSVPPVRLRRWIDLAERDWYSGDLHIHRTLDELRNIVLAEDLNIVFPLTNWVTIADTPPSAGDKNLQGELPKELIRVDDHHVIWPRSTEYEIFRVGGQRHTLGALFVLGHREALQQTVPPWKPVVDAALQADPDVLFDMDKLAWPFAMTLPVIAPSATYELANNHMWRTEFAFSDWYTPTPAYIQPPYGAERGDERAWIDFTLGMYYTLLNCGFRLPPSAGTANGVHPVPAGFGRVYVHLPDGFDDAQWRRGLREGRSFVTTGPMLIATAQDKQAGHTFEFTSDEETAIPLRIEVVSDLPITFGEILINGVPEHLLRPRGEKTAAGAFRSVLETSITPNRSGWFAVRMFSEDANGRPRFAHTAPWYVEIDAQPVRPSWSERQYLIGRMRDEIQRSRGVVSEAALEEYQQVLEHYRSLEVSDDSAVVQDNARPLDESDRQAWLENMIVDHRYSADEVRRATGWSIEQSQREIQRFLPTRPSEGNATIKVLPFPGGRHPRRGFLDGAIDPQRDTKISVFPPWSNGGYAVVDVPEAIFSNLGLTYLAHTHVPTIWTEAGVELEPLEWQQSDDGLRFQRSLPNGISFGSHVASRRQHVSMKMWLRNGTSEPLSKMRAQVCVMLKGLIGFQSQRRRQPVLDGSVIAIRADHADRWLVTAWEPNHRAWANPPVPCIHSDPIFPDCPPGETVSVQGGMWFYEGDDIQSEISRIKSQYSWISD